MGARLGVTMKLADTVLEELWFSEENTDDATDIAKESLAARIATTGGLKPFPIVAQKALEVLSNPHFRLVEITTVLEEDPALAAGVLRMANSAFFAGSKSCASIAQAFVRMGGMSVKETVLSVAAMQMFPDVEGAAKKVRDHCVGVAAIVQSLAREFVPDYTDGMFLCGLMHDIGKMLLVESGEIVYSPIDAAEHWRFDTMHLEERARLGYDHAVLGGHILKSWKFPDPIPKVTAWHHQPTRAYEDRKIGDMTAILRIADQLDITFRDAPETIMEFVDALEGKPDMEFVSLTRDDIKRILDKLYAGRLDALRMFGG